ncbi:hypothetical protein CASFOL_016853 [Castilleja foliolosa]|uniref:Pectinesterase inhibitor domain-containing protein n=1 Tax=Castilleja foliolosa TaxID=1961234 RepID=A0ABD3D9E5_9LAMI
MCPSKNIILVSLTIALSLFFTLVPTNAQKDKAHTNPNPYETVNNFCLHKRLNVAKPFCLRVLKNPKAANVKPNDFNPLLQVAVNSTSSYVCKTLSQLLDLSEDLKTKPSLIPTVDKCIEAYEDVANYITNVFTDASQESTIAGLDGEVIEEYINGCIKASVTTRDPDIAEWNNEAKTYAKLMIDIADNLSNNEHK